MLKRLIYLIIAAITSLISSILLVNASNLSKVSIFEAITQASFVYKVGGDDERSCFGKLEDVKRLPESDSVEPSNLRTHASVLDIYGDIRFCWDDFSGAIEAYVESIKIKEKLAKRLPEDKKLERNLLASLNRVARIYREENELGRALEYYKRALEIAEPISKANLNDSDAQLQTAALLQTIGIVQQEHGKFLDALRTFEREFEMARQLAVANNDLAAASDAVFATYKMADIQARLRNFDVAIGGYDFGLELAEEILRVDPDNFNGKRAIYIYHSKLGDVSRWRFAISKALEHFHQALKIAKELALSNPENPETQRDIYLSMYKIGLVTRDKTEVRRIWNDALAINSELISKHPNPRYLKDRSNFLEDLQKL